MFGRSGRILEKEDEDAADVVKAQLLKDGVDFKLKVKYQNISKVCPGPHASNTLLCQRGTPLSRQLAAPSCAALTEWCAPVCREG